MNIDTNKAKNLSKAVNEIKFPEPNFKFDNSNPEQYAKEKEEYLKKAIPYIQPANKGLQIKILEAIEKYGTHEYCDKLGIYMGTSDEEVIRPLVRAIAATGKPRDTLLITSFLEIKNRKYAPETYIEILNAASKIGRVKDTETLKPLLSHEHPGVKKTAQTAIQTIMDRNVPKPIAEIKFPEPNFKFDNTNSEKFAKEKKEYVDSILPYTEHTDKNLNIKALNAIEKYGTSEHLDIIGGNFVSTTDEELIKPFVKTVMAVGKPVEHSYYLFGWLENPDDKLSTGTYKEIFKGIEKIGVKPGLYKYLPKVFNKVSTSPDDELAKALTNTLCKVSTKEHIPELQKYAGSENPVVRESIAKIIKTVGHKS